MVQDVKLCYYTLVSGTIFLYGNHCDCLNALFFPPQSFYPQLFWCLCVGVWFTFCITFLYFALEVSVLL